MKMVTEMRYVLGESKAYTEEKTTSSDLVNTAKNKLTPSTEYLKIKQHFKTIQKTVKPNAKPSSSSPLP